MPHSDGRGIETVAVETGVVATVMTEHNAARIVRIHILVGRTMEIAVLDVVILLTRRISHAHRVVGDPRLSVSRILELQDRVIPQTVERTLGPDDAACRCDPEQVAV